MLEYFPIKKMNEIIEERRQSKQARLKARSGGFTPQHHEHLARHRHASLKQMSPEAEAAAVALGVHAMNTITLTPMQYSFLRILVQEMGVPAQCDHSSCRARNACTQEKVECYWRNREHVRASFPPVDDALLRDALQPLST